jgi:hypothetical protein
MLASMNRSVQILSIVLLLTLASVVSAQTPLACGIVGIDGPSQVASGTPIVLKAKISGMIHTTKPEFKWKVSAGTITLGQGTDEICVDTTGLGGVDVIATVELAGAPLGCNTSADKKMQIEPHGFTCTLRFDEYGDLKFEDEKARLDNFAIQITNEPLSSGYILMSAGLITFENEATERLDRAKSYLVNVREIDPSRVFTVDCGFAKELSINLHIVPIGSTPPPCSNSVDPLAEIKFTKPRPEASKKKRR